MSLITVATWRADLGSFECETCGYNWEEIEVTREEGKSLFEAYYRVGCYGGASLPEPGTLAEVKAWLDSEMKGMPAYQETRSALFQRLDSGMPDDVEEWG